ncbi:helix-turn-helix domain-containing protein [Rhodoferax sp.]|uniref:helix-turn-helix domain-containing protein n=1 Tax=Rhodoferax sp. TaxID=50421 RepID=UPI002ACDD3A9|nr:helix-turn-helix domain-containing protein [Rhodoferax sp.]MDZ7920508.1 helix-turn-helix domain-containing protein [Rhodoferax sp.]
MNEPAGKADEADAPSWARSVLTFDIDAHAASQGDWRLHYEQLSSGDFRGELLMLQLSGVSLTSEKTNLALRQRGRLGEDVYGFAMSVDPSGDVYFDGRKVHPDAILCGSGREIDFVTPPKHHLIGLTVDRSLLDSLWDRMYQKPLATWLERQVDLRPTSENAIALRAKHLQDLKQALALAQHFTDAADLNQLRDDILIEWIEAIPPNVDVSDMDSLARRKRLVDKACDLMLVNRDLPPSILDICSQVGASRRKLNYCFQDVLGISPTQYLRALRLNGVRRSLRQAEPDETVQDIATRWGFWHQGQFSLDYKKHFFQLPSETLNRARRRLYGANPKGASV